MAVSADGQLALKIFSLSATGALADGITPSPKGMDNDIRKMRVGGKELTSEKGDSPELEALAWNHDSKAISAAGSATRATGGGNVIRTWSGSGFSVADDFAAGNGTGILGLESIPAAGGGKDDLLTAAGACIFGTVSGGVFTTLGKSPVQGFNNFGFFEKFTLNGDATMVGFQNGVGDSAYFSLASRTLTKGPPKKAGSMTAPRISGKNIRLSKWFDSRDPELNGQPLPLNEGDISRRVAISKDGTFFIYGTTFKLGKSDVGGSWQWYRPAPATVLGINLSANGRVAVVAYSDGTIRWHDAERGGKELLIFFPHADKKRWVLWTPEGYYDCSAGGENLIGWHVNRKKDESADFFPAAQFRTRFHRPDVLEELIKDWDPVQALARANAARPDAEPAAPVVRVVPPEKQEPAPAPAAPAGAAMSPAPDIRLLLPPVVELTSPKDGDKAQNPITLRYRVRRPAGLPVEAVRVMVDGRPVESALLPVPGSETDEITVQITLPETGRAMILAVQAESRHAFSEPALARLSAAGPPSALLPGMYLLAVGAEGLGLSYPDEDAQALAAALQRQEGLAYSKVTTKVLTGAAATKDAILDGLQWLEHSATSRDFAAIFLAGHGHTDTRKTYYFVPHGFDEKRLRATGLNGSELVETVKRLAGRPLLFLDTCNAGTVLPGLETLASRDMEGANAALANQLQDVRNNACVFVSSLAQQESLEGDGWGHGAFTKALLEGLEGGKEGAGPAFGPAVLPDTDTVTFESLDLYICERIKTLTQGNQSAVGLRPKTVEDFIIARKLRK